jgi:ABC-type lipoprotein release transport system permease subunit
LILISATNIYSNIVSFIIEKKNEIGTMILLGASKKSLILVFTFVGLFLGLIGTFIGALLSAATIYFITRTNIIDSLSIDVSFYQIEGFPIIFSIEYFIFISLFSIVAVIISSFIPSYLILNKDLESLIRRNY